MNKLMNGSEIVASIAGERAYWQIGTSDVHRWVDTLPASAIQEHFSRIEWVGGGWDGKSDVRVGCEHEQSNIVTAEEITQLLDELSRGITELGIAGISPPSPNDVRICCIGTTDQIVLAIDVDFGDFILPLCIDDRRYWVTEKTAIAEIASGMLGILSNAAKTRQRLLKREHVMRRALEETTAKIGNGVAPLWLRLEPFPYYEDPKWLATARYVMLMVVLTEDLIWAPKGEVRIATAKDVRDHHRWHNRFQMVRAAALRLQQSQLEAPRLGDPQALAA